MPTKPAYLPSRHKTLLRHAGLLMPLAFCLITASAAAQISLTTAIDLGLKNNPKILMAEADVEKARAQLAESRDVYIPALVGGSGLGYSYGFPLGQPTVFSLTSQSLLFNFSQHDYIRAARAGLQAANFALKDARQQVEEDIAITYLSLDRAQQRKAALAEEYSFATRLVAIVQDRLNAGQETTLELLRSRRTAAQVRLQQVQLENEIGTYADHLSRLSGLPASTMTLPESIPAFAAPTVQSTGAAAQDSPAVSAAVANAAAKRYAAFGDARYLWRPQVAFAAQYSRFSNFNNYKDFYPTFNNFNAAAIGVQIQLPMFDRAHRDRARGTAADAVHAEQEVRSVRMQFQEGRLKLLHSTSELAARADLAAIDRSLAQTQLDILLVQLQSGLSVGSAPLMTPKDEQNARIQERQRFLELLDADFQLRQLQINLLRHDGQLDDWLKSVARSQSSTTTVSLQ